MKFQHKNIVFEVEYDTTQGAYFRQSKKSLYVEQYLLFRQKIINNVGKFIPIEVKIKPPPKHYHTVVSKKGSNLYHDSKHARLVNYPRKNAFEVSVDNFVVFSRLKQGGWPNVDKISQWALRVFMRITEEDESQQTQIRKTSQSHRKKSMSMSNCSKSSLNQSILQDKGRGKIIRSVNKKKSPPHTQRYNHRTLHVPTQKQRKKSSSRYSMDNTSENSMPRGVEAKSKIETQVSKYLTKRKKKDAKESKEKKQKTSIEHKIDKIYRSYSTQKPKSKGSTPFHWDFSTATSIKRAPTSTSRAIQQSSKLDTHKPETIDEVLEQFQMTTSNQIRRQYPIIQVKAIHEHNSNIDKVFVSLSEQTKFDCEGVYEVKDDNRVKKISENCNWSYLSCQQFLPLKGLYYIALAVLRSSQNNIEVGLAPLNSDSQQASPNEIDGERLVSYNCRSGMIKDSKVSEHVNSTCWRPGGEPAPTGISFQLKLAIDMDQQEVEWYIDDSIVASSKMPPSFMLGFRLVFSLFNTEDSVLLNEEDWRGRLRIGKFNKSSYILEPRQNKQKSGKIRRTLVASTPTDYANSKEIFNYSTIKMNTDHQNTHLTRGKIRHQRLFKYGQDRVKNEENHFISPIEERSFMKEDSFECQQQQVKEILGVSFKKKEDPVNQKQKYQNKIEKEVEKNQQNKSEIVKDKPASQKESQQTETNLYKKQDKQDNYEPLTDQEQIKIEWIAFFTKQQGYNLVLREMLPAFLQKQPKPYLPTSTRHLYSFH